MAKVTAMRKAAQAGRAPARKTTKEKAREKRGKSIAKQRQVSRIKRTKESTDFFESLNLFIMFATALGLCGSVALTEFLEFTVYDTIRMRGYDWRVAHELFVVMLRRIEDSGGKLTFVNCMAESHLSTVLDEALMSAKHYYGAAFFRQNAEGARSRNGNPDDKDKVDHCTNGKFTATAKECCPHWNMGMPHPLSAVTENGVFKRNLWGILRSYPPKGVESGV